jgi:cytochrome bd-type quinol oxidase subunit 2
LGHWRALSFILPLSLLAIVLVYAGFDIKKLRRNKEYGLAQYFLFFLILPVTVSFVTLYAIFPYVTPKLLI